jgi:hypothetical protein
VPTSGFPSPTIIEETKSVTFKTPTFHRQDAKIAKKNIGFSEKNIKHLKTLINKSCPKAASCPPPKRRGVMPIEIFLKWFLLFFGFKSSLKIRCLSWRTWRLGGKNLAVTLSSIPVS